MAESAPESAAESAPYAAVVLAGGASSRLGRDKILEQVAGRSLLDLVLDAVADAVPLVVVGPRRPVGRPVTFTREQPPGGGPVAGLAAGLALVDTEWVAVLAGDQPFLRPRHVAALRVAAQGRDGAVLVDSDGRRQHLAGVWRSSALRGALAGWPGPAGVGVRRLIEPLDVAEVRLAADVATPPPWHDVDTEADLEQARRWS